jgi:acetolactate synthase-1/3 small subunit
MRHIISLLLENEPGALSRVVGLFSQRNYNIESLTVAPTEDPTLSRLTLTTVGHDEVIEQITKNLNKLIEVVKLVDLSESAHIERELMLVKVKATGAQRAEIKRTTDIYRVQATSWTASSSRSGRPRFWKLYAVASPGLLVATKYSASNSN